jgi:DNA-binding transcriptional ArsR family regulator
MGKAVANTRRPVAIERRRRIVAAIGRLGPLSISATARAAGLPVATAYRHLKALEEAGVLRSTWAQRAHGTRVFALPGQVVKGGAKGPMTPRQRKAYQARWARLTYAERGKAARERNRAFAERQEVARRVAEARVTKLAGQPPEVVEEFRRRTLAAWGGVAS